MDRSKCVILLNPRARGGKAQELWNDAEHELLSELEPTIVELDDAGGWVGRVQEAIKAGQRFFVAAGGDGTVHALVNALLSPETLPLARENRPILGAIGLGSSNDFHKPFPTSISIPSRLSSGNTRRRDVGRVLLYRGEAPAKVRYFIISASVGAVADGNAYFNAGEGVVGSLKKHSTDLAIGTAVLRTIARHRPANSTFIEGPESFDECRLSNLSVLKVPYLAGALHYDLPIEPDDGLFHATAWIDMSRPELLSTIVGLMQGRYRLSDKKLYWKSKSLELAMPTLVPVELDGEIYEADRVKFELVPGAIEECLPEP